MMNRYLRTALLAATLMNSSAALADSITGGDSSAKVDKAAGKVDKAKGRVNSAASKANASAQGKLNGVGLGGGVR